MRISPFPSALMALLAACGGGDPAAPRVPVASVVVTGADTLVLDQTAPYVAELRDSAGTLLTGRRVRWATPDSAVASVDDQGLLAVRDTGAARLIATSEGISDTITIVAVSLRLTQVSAGRFESCALDSGGRAWCWGRFALSPFPVALADSHRFASVAVGDSLACGLTLTGAAWCWSDPRTGATALAGVPPLERLTLGMQHGCGLTSAGEAWCWGANGQGELGNGGFSAAPVAPSAVTGGQQYRAIAAGSFHTCAVTVAGVGQCWGGNGNGQLGVDSVAGSLVPLAIDAPPTAYLEITGNLSHSCAVAADSTAWCWGDGNSGQMGDNRRSFSKIPVPVHGGFRATVIAAGIYHTCALAPGGAAWCWGSNDRGQLGVTGIAEDSVPVAVSGGHLFATLSGGLERHDCGLTTGGVVYCWGENFYGELGVAGGGSSAVPVKVTGQR